MHTLSLAACTTSTSILVRPLRIALLLACSMQETNTKRTELAGRDAITSRHRDGVSKIVSGIDTEYYVLGSSYVVSTVSTVEHSTQ